MSDTAVIVLIVVLLVAAAAAIFGIVRKRQLDARSEEEKRLRAAEKAYKQHVRASEKELRRATKTYDAGVSAAQWALEAAKRMGSDTVDQIRGKEGKVSYTQLGITTPEGFFLLEPSMRATVQTAGQITVTSRSTLTRMAAGGLIMGPLGVVAGAAARKTTKHDDRELYLLIEASRFVLLLTLKPDEGEAARKFASGLMSAARGADALRKRKQKEIAECEQSLIAIKADTAAVEAARLNLEQAQADTAELNAARLAFEQQQAAAASTA